MRALPTLLFVLAACEGSSTPAEPSAPAPSTSTPPPELFAEQPFRVSDVKVATGRTAAPRDLDVRATLRVIEAVDDGVKMPVRIACDTGDHRVVTVSEMVTPRGRTHSLRKPGAVEIFVHAPTNLGPVPSLRRCEIELHATRRKAKDAPPVVERICWENGAVRPGACELATPPAPSAAFAVHGLEGRFDGHLLRVVGWIQSRDARASKGIVHARAGCAGASESQMDIVDLDGFSLAAGESIALGFDFFGGQPRPVGACTLHLAWQDVRPDGEPPTPMLELGAWCVTDDGTTEGPCT